MNTHVKPPKAGEVAEAAPDIHARMVAVMRDLGAIGKDKKNEAQGFKYRGIDDVYNAINPILAEHGVFMTAEVLTKSREERVTIKEYQGNKKESVLAFTCLKMRYHFRAEDGSSVSTEAEGEGMDSGDKSSNKAMAVAHKYALLQAFCIPTQDLDDPDAHVHEVAAKPNGQRQPTPPPAPQTQRDAIHTLKTPEPIREQDPDVVKGLRNWADQNKAEISEAERLPDLYMWLDENGESWTNPTSSSNLRKLQKHAPEILEELKTHYMATLAEIGKKATK